MATPHINAKLGDFASTVLFPGDPLRAKYIADNFLKNVKEVTNIRNMLGFTGEYNHKQISVMGSGMGIPSCSIYAKELITEYKVQNIIRIGTAGGLKTAKLNDIVLVQGASTDSNVNRSRLKGFDYSATSSFKLLLSAYNAAIKKNIPITVGNCFSSDYFYNPLTDLIDYLDKMQILCIEMEAAGLFGVAAEYNANALAILTISDEIRTHKSISAEERQTKLNNMIEIALNMENI